MNFAESEELTMMRDTVRRFVDVHCPVAKIEEWEANNSLPRDIVEKMAEAGFLGLTVPEKFGGLGRQVLAMTVVLEELARRSHMILSLYNMSAGYGSLNIALEGSDAQRARFLPKLMAGELLFAMGLSEPDVGADLASVTTTAERRGDKVIINGAKRWTTGAAIADYVYTLVRSGPAGDRRKNLSFVLVPCAAPGVTITGIRCMGMEGLATTDVIFDEVEIPFDLVIGEELGWNNGWTMLLGPALEVEKIAPTACGVGIAAAALDEAWEYSQQRRQGGDLICNHQSVRHVLADCQTKLKAARLMLYDSANKVERGEPSALDSAMAKLFCGEICRDIVIACQQYVMGAYGYAKGFQMERYVRDILSIPIAGGSSAIQKNNIANLMRLGKDGRGQ